MSKPDHYRNLIWLLVAMSAFVPGGTRRLSPLLLLPGTPVLHSKKGCRLAHRLGPGQSYRLGSRLLSWHSDLHQQPVLGCSGPVAPSPMS